MTAIKASVNTDSVTTALQYPLVGSDYGEKVTTIDQLPRGTALHAARTPLTKDAVRCAPFSKPSTDTGVFANTTTPEVKLVHNNSTSSSLNKSSDHEDVSTASESTDTKISVNNVPLCKSSSGADLARRAARRVNVWKKSEQERRGEEERARQAKLEQDKRRQNHAAHAKQRRRAEIYALNALLRQLQQEKVARYIAAQKQLQEAQQADCQKGVSLTSTIAASAKARAVGV